MKVSRCLRIYFVRGLNMHRRHRAVGPIHKPQINHKTSDRHITQYAPTCESEANAPKRGRHNTLSPNISIPSNQSFQLFLHSHKASQRPGVFINLGKGGDNSFTYLERRIFWEDIPPALCQLRKPYFLILRSAEFYRSGRTTWGERKRRRWKSCLGAVLVRALPGGNARA